LLSKLIIDSCKLFVLTTSKGYTHVQDAHPAIPPANNIPNFDDSFVDLSLK
jgi:hypothetical protein